MSPAARLLAAIALRWGVGLALFRFQRVVLLALFPEQAVLQVFDLGILENRLLSQLFKLGFCSRMLRFPIACPTGEINMLLFGDRDPLLREWRRLPCIEACERAMPLRSRAGIYRAFHGPAYTLFVLLCPVLSARRVGSTEYLQFVFSNTLKYDVF
jgi:hypothetical protein